MKKNLYKSPEFTVIDIDVEEPIGVTSQGSISFGDVSDPYTPSVESYNELGTGWTTNNIDL